MSGSDPLRIVDDFPPVSRADWDAAIAKDLEAAGLKGELLWVTDEGVNIRPYYTRQDTVALDSVIDIAPGEFPFTRGSGKDWQEAVWQPPVDAIRADRLHDAGATAVQELAFALAEAVERLATWIDEGLNVETAAARCVFAYAVGSNYFMEIAKLRAARLLWSQALLAFDCDPLQLAPARIHARTARLNKSHLDTPVNLLRVTTEAMAAVIGGCDSLAVEPFGFSEHTAAAVQHILCHEAHLGRVADPAGGSYYVEALTYSLAREAWTLFQDVEEEGGWFAALRNGFVERELARSLEVQRKATDMRVRTLVGVNNYPNLASPPLEGDLLPAGRLSEPFERIRYRTQQHGSILTVLLLTRGDVKIRAARANFCMNCFACAGFSTIEAETYKGQAADLIVLCSADTEYLALAGEICPQVSCPVLVAGYPRDQITALEAIGIQGFVHVHSNLLETLTYWQDRLGLEELEIS